MISSAKKKIIIDRFKKSANDISSHDVQIAILSERIREISAHLKLFPKDFASQCGLLKLVGRRRRFLTYLKRNYSEQEFSEYKNKLESQTSSV
jgi:small subunit ribosomal protein S15